MLFVPPCTMPTAQQHYSALAQNCEQIILLRTELIGLCSGVELSDPGAAVRCHTVGFQWIQVLWHAIHLSDPCSTPYLPIQVSCSSIECGTSAQSSWTPDDLRFAPPKKLYPNTYLYVHTCMVCRVMYLILYTFCIQTDIKL